MHRLPCSILSLDISDFTGHHTSNVKGTLQKTRLDESGKIIQKNSEKMGEDKEHEVIQPNIEELKKALNNKEYAMKKMMLKTKAEIKRNKEQNDIICNYIKKTESNGVIKIFGTQCNEIENNLDDLDNKYEYNFYVLMELADIDWEKEINKRKITKKSNRKKNKRIN